MSFQLIISQNTYFKIRKEEDSDKTHSLSSCSPREKERASLFTSFRGSIVVEASLVLPLFFFAVCCLCYLLEMMAIQVQVHAAAHSVGREVAQQMYAAPIVFPSKLEADIAEQIGVERMDQSAIKGGSRGLDCSGTSVLPGTGIIRMHIAYKVELPFVVFGRLSLSCEDEFCIKGWTGYVKEGFTVDREEMVYVTDTGLVYHRDPNCNYLDLSIQMVSKSNLGSLRNEDGKIYRPCRFCGRGAGGKVYITRWGTRYHSSLACRGLKRSVYEVPVSEVQGKGACSKCGYSYSYRGAH